MHNFTKFIVVVAVIGAGICAALPFRRLPPPSESTLVENDIPGQDAGIIDMPPNANQQPAAEHVELSMSGGTGQDSPDGNAGARPHDGLGDGSPRVTRAPKIRGERPEEAEFQSFDEHAPPPDLPSDFQRSFDSNTKQSDDPYAADRITEDAWKTEIPNASKVQNKKKNNAKKRPAGRNRLDQRSDLTTSNSNEIDSRREFRDGAVAEDSGFPVEPKNEDGADDSFPFRRSLDSNSTIDADPLEAENSARSAEPLDDMDIATDTVFAERDPVDYSRAEKRATDALSDNIQSADEATENQTAGRRPRVDVLNTTEFAEDHRKRADGTGVTPREPTAPTSPLDEPERHKETGFRTPDEASPTESRDRDFRTSTASDIFSSGDQYRTTADKPRRDTLFDSARDETETQSVDPPDAGNHGRRAPTASMAVTRPYPTASSDMVAEPSRRVASTEGSATPTFRRPRSQPSTGEAERSGAAPSQGVTPQIARRLPTAIATGPHYHQYIRHRVADGDSLASLAQRYLGNRNRYAEIFNANRHVLASPDILPIGVELVIPVTSTNAGGSNAGGVGIHTPGGWQARPDSRAPHELVPIPADAFPRRNR